MFNRLASDGCLVFDKLFDPALIERAYDEYERQYGVFDEDELPLHMNVGDRRLHLPIALMGALLDPLLYANPLLMMAPGTVFGEPYLIDNATVVTAGQSVAAATSDPLPDLHARVVYRRAQFQEACPPIGQPRRRRRDPGGASAVVPSAGGQGIA